jgi:hypothetical protein
MTRVYSDDLAAVSTLISRMNFATDSYDADQVRAVWATGGRILFTDETGGTSIVVGRDAIVAAAEAAWKTGPMERHVVSCAAITLVGTDNAEVRYYALYTMPAAVPVVPTFGDHRVRAHKDTDGRWWIVEHRAVQYARPQGTQPR